MSTYTKTASDERVTNLQTGLDTTALMTGVETWWSTMAQCQQELGGFVADRLAKDGEAMRQALSCRDWSVALDIQARWVEETLRDYNAEMSKLAGLYVKSASSTVREERRRA
jgi:hypothetical protein